MQAAATISILPVVQTGAGRSSGFSSLADEDLMVRYGRGDRDAFEELYRRHRAGLHRFIRRLTSADADEVFQEVWLAVIKGRKRYAPAARFVTWLYTIAHHRAVARLRHNGLWRGETCDEDAAADDMPGPFETTFGGELAGALQAAIAALPPAEREAFLMQAEGGLSLDEIALATGALRETVKSRLRYANRRLRAALEMFR
jgi:RNA polymerase sigma-70 factor (ECF subfamily)